MKIITTLKIAIASWCLIFTSTVNGQAINEGFDNITTLVPNGWFMQNNSTPIGTTNWLQGDATTFPAQSGATTSFIAANFNNVAGNNTISNWLLTPARTFKNGDVITFYTRKTVDFGGYNDRMEVRMSTNGASTNVGTGSAAVGDFTTVLLTINPTLVAGGYPQAWQLYTITISGLPAPTVGRVAFRYFVTNGGPSGFNGDYIGIDNFVYTPYVCPAFTMTPNGALPVGTAGSGYSNTITQSGALGTPTFAVTAGALPPGLTLAANGTISGTPTATGTFNFSVTVSDASGCTGAGSYSIQTNCPANPTSLTGLPTLCTNDGVYTLVQGSPGGGTYSGAGVSAGTFNPSSGTQLITYDYTDPYGCAHSTSASIIVNPAPTVTQSAFVAVCENAAPVALSGGSPAGGTYSGTGVTAGNFDPSQGTQMITYAYTDGNGCSNSAMETFTVNGLPTVTQTPFTAVCEDAGSIALSGGSPAGGTYSGTGVAAGNFDATQGTQTITYTYIDGNGCSNAASELMTVNDLPTVSHTPFTAVCANNGTVALSGGSPAGGTYSGTGVTAGNFDPAQGTQTITYTYIDGNGCSNAAMETFTVNNLPNVTLTFAFAPICSTDPSFSLSGGSPAGGTYSGVGVTAGNFNPGTAGVGVHMVTYDYTDANGCSASAMDDVTVNDCLNLNELNSSNITVYPNPGKGVFTVTTENTDALTDLNISDLSGRIIANGIVNINGELTIQITDAQTGVYVFSGKINGKPFAVRLMKE